MRCVSQHAGAYLHTESVLDRMGGLPNEGLRSGDLFGVRGGDGGSGGVLCG